MSVLNCHSEIAYTYNSVHTHIYMYENSGMYISYIIYIHIYNFRNVYLYTYIFKNITVAHTICMKKGNTIKIDDYGHHVLIPLVKFAGRSTI